MNRERPNAKSSNSHNSLSRADSLLLGLRDRTPIMSMRELRYKDAQRYYQKSMLEYEKRRRSIWFRFRFFLRYSGLRAVLAENRATLFECENRGHSNFVYRNVQFKAHTLHIQTVVTGLNAWSFVETDPDTVAFTLTCSKCRYLHIICEKRFSISFGAYDGLYRSPWFELFNPKIWDKSKNMMVCQSCGYEGSPIIRRFPHNPLIAKPKHPGNPNDPAYADPIYPKLP
jgi:hypothetical protein